MIAPNSYFYCNLCQNALSTNINNNKLANSPPEALIESSGFPVPYFYILTLEPTFSAVLPTSSLFVVKYTNKDLQRAIKLALKLFVQGEKQAQT